MTGVYEGNAQNHMRYPADSLKGHSRTLAHATVPLLVKATASAGVAPTRRGVSFHQFGYGIILTRSQPRQAESVECSP